MQTRLTNTEPNPKTAQISHAKVMPSLNVCTSQDNNTSHSLVNKIRHGKDNLGFADGGMLLLTDARIHLCTHFVSWCCELRSCCDKHWNKGHRLTRFYKHGQKAAGACLMKRAGECKGGQEEPTRKGELD